MKRYTVRYMKKGKSIITAVSNYIDVMNLLKDANGSVVETRISENMPSVMHKEIAKHNEKINDTL